MKYKSLMCLAMIFGHVKPSHICNADEYGIAGKCCPMCSAGTWVYKHCTEFSNTSCEPCTNSTYTDQPGGFPVCTPCTNCVPDSGLMDKQSCTPSSDTVCEPLEGFYCTEPTKDGCKAAQRHSSCKPGQYRQKGTPSTDTVCSDCTDGTYSDGSFTSCQPHTQYDTLKLQQIKPGTRLSDSECGSQTPTAVIIGAVLGAVLGGVALALIIPAAVCLFKKKFASGRDTHHHPNDFELPEVRTTPQRPPQSLPTHPQDLLDEGEVSRNLPDEG
ncbi:hypothetical protein DPEC_G00014740 [Dallia pectoralis]|uniref:Uncharacterized protein n=1 Tax=Dallia pectoralis TaxID=75939 RepID=A0ACC2HMI0_DALPE|nr:hypothetical protein DPEC_G00014740 [Dallia pectoralis]